MNLELGQSVHYIMPETSHALGAHRAAVIVALPIPTAGQNTVADLAVFTLSPKEFGTPNEYGMENRVLNESDNLVTIAGVPYDKEHNPGTFHLTTDVAPVVAPPVVPVEIQANAV